MTTTRLVKAPILLAGAKAAILVEMILYGIHLLLFFICADILIKHRNYRQLALLLPLTAMLFLTAADIAMSSNVILADFPSSANDDVVTSVVLAWLYPKNPLYVTNNFLADGLLLYRCYVVWGKQRCIIAVPASLIIAGTVWGYMSIGTSIFALGSLYSLSFLWSVFVFNLVMTTATAGRIWWIARSTSRLWGKQAARRYQFALTVLIESGAIYCVPLLMMLVVPHKPYSLIFQALSIRLVAIVPTLMVIQVELGGWGDSAGRDARPSGYSGKATVSSMSSTYVPSGSLEFAEKNGDLEPDQTSRW